VSDEEKKWHDAIYSLRMKLARKADLDDHLAMAKSENFKISQNSGASSKKINKSELDSIKHIHVEGRLNSEIDSVQQ